MVSSQDFLFMKRAIALAKARKGLTHPNPTVGCVIVKNGKIVGEGVHLKAGKPHAEVVALKRAGFQAKGSTVYITLEPCAHYGKTPPCSLELIKAGVKRVVVATLDPNPKVAGKGIENLKRAGIEVTIGVCEKEAKKLNEDFFHWITTQTPFVVLKIAQTLDGFIATKEGESKWITSKKSRKTVHRLRCESSAILVGVKTVLKDNPHLTVRLYPCEKKPLRVVLDTYLKIPENAKILDNNAPTLIFTAKGDPKKIKRLEDRGIQVVKIPAKGGLLDLKEVLKVLGKREVVQLLVEGGAKIFGEFFKQKLWNKLVVYTAPKVFGSGKSPFEGFKLTDLQKGEVLRLENLKRIGNDIYAEYYPVR